MRAAHRLHLESAQSHRLTIPFALFFLAVHAPALGLAGNRFGFLAPSLVLLFGLLTLHAPRLAPPRYASWLWLGVMAWGGLQIALSLTPDPGEAARVLTRFASYGAVFLIAAMWAETGRGAVALVKGAALWITALCIYGLIAWASGVNPILGTLEAYNQPLEASFVNRNAFALYAGFGVMAALTAGWMSAAQSRWIWWAAAGICALALALTESRGGIAASLAGLTVMALMQRRAALAMFVLIGGVVVTSVAVGVWGRDLLAEEGRFLVHQLVLTQSFEAPLTGHGLGAFQDAMRPHLGESWRWGDWDHAHQQYLETAFELGWPAALALFAAILVAPGKPRLGSRTSALAFGALTAAGLHAFIDFSLAIPTVVLTLALFLGVARGRA